MLGSGFGVGLTGADGAGVANAVLPDLLARCEALFFFVIVDLPMRFCSVVWPLNLLDIRASELHASSLKTQILQLSSRQHSYGKAKQHFRSANIAFVGVLTFLYCSS